MLNISFRENFGILHLRHNKIKYLFASHKSEKFFKTVYNLNALKQFSSHLIIVIMLVSHNKTYIIELVQLSAFLHILSDISS